MNPVAEVGLAKATEHPIDSSPLVVDLNALVKTDLQLEAFLALLKQNAWYVFYLPIWLIKGKTDLQQQVARRISVDVAALPYREELLAYLNLQHTEGRTLVLITSGDLKIARQVADHLALFDFVFGRERATSLSGASRPDRLVNRFEEKQFDYAGNAPEDLAIWASARKAILVNPSPRVRSRAAKVTQIDRVFEEPEKRLADYLKPLRLQHWSKNVLLFVTLLAAHRLDEIGSIGKLLLAFLSFGCFASCGYVINDMFDLSADRHHPTKRLRRFASGDLPLSCAFVMIPALAGLGCLIGALVSQPFLGMVLGYFALTLTYSLYFKKIAILDVITLSGLYSIRIMAGAAAVAIWPSHWLLAFSTFFFFSLALVKRYSELVIMRKQEGDRAKARGYELDDSELLAAMGVASGFLAVLVLALYINSDEAQSLYGRYQLIWFLCPMLFYWIGRVWLIAHRGEMPDDPVVFALNDPANRTLIVLMLVLVALAL